MPTSHSHIRLEIDLSAIKYNYALLVSMLTSPEAKAAAVVKANAYGLGVEPVASSLHAAGARDFFVATLDEAIELSKVALIDSNIYVFHGVKNGEQDEFSARNITPVINDFYQLEIWHKKAKQENLILPAILNFDTGMNRLGFNTEQAKKLSTSSQLKNLEIKYIMSHLCAITDATHELNAMQLKRMHEIKKSFPKIPVTLANSSGIAAGEEYHFNLVRPGCALYGIKGGTTSENLPLKNVVTSRAKILQIRDVTEDGFAGYDATVEVKKGMRLAIVPMGYADGYLRSLSNHSHAHFNGHKIKLLGRVSMDLTIFDISKIPQNEINVGDEIEIFGAHYPLDEIAKNAGTIGYEILTNLGKRYKRSYI